MSGSSQYFHPRFFEFSPASFFMDFFGNGCPWKQVFDWHLSSLFCLSQLSIYDVVGEAHVDLDRSPMEKSVRSALEVSTKIQENPRSSVVK